MGDSSEFSHSLCNMGDSSEFSHSFCFRSEREIFFEFHRERAVVESSLSGVVTVSRSLWERLLEQRNSIRTFA